MKMLASAAMVAAVFVSAPALAATNLVTNGGFDQTSLQSSKQFKDDQVTGWKNAVTTGYTGYGYNFLIQSGTADTTGFESLGNNRDYLYGNGGGQKVAANDVWSGDNFADNGLTASSKSGGNYLLADGDTRFHGGISQDVTGLTLGQVYTLTFEWAGASWATTPGNTTHRFDVTFGGVTQQTETLNLGPKGFSGWTTASMDFVATGASQTLTFLAQGTPNGLPPSLLLDNVSLTAAVPEPSTWAMMFVGFAMVGAASRYRRRNVKAVIA